MSRDAEMMILAVLSLIAIGIVMTYSASAIYADMVMEVSSTFFLYRQIFYFGIGSVLLFLVSWINPSFYQKNSRLIALIALGCLITVYLPFLGQSMRKTRRWLSIFGFNFQPAEFCKLALCVYFSDYLSRKLKKISRGSFSVFLPPLIVLMMCTGLILMQPDLGSVIILFIISATLFFLAGIRQRYIWSFFMICSVISYFAIIKVPYRMNRILAYLDPWKDPQGNGFQIIQSFLALSSGGVDGVGLGQSTQKLFYLPQSYTDFIFSIIGEELGFLGTSLVVSLFLAFAIFGIRIANRQYDIFRKFLVLSLVLLIVVQAIINIFVATGLLPTKGLPLPFISYGGSSLIMNMMAVGIIISIDRDRSKYKR